MVAKYVVLAAAACAAVAAHCARIPLAENGKAKVSVVLAADATESERFAADELAKWLHAATGAEIPVGAEQKPGLVPIRFLRSDPEVKYDGFSIDASGRGIAIAANRPIGILFGVYYILNRWCGVYWCHPDAEADFEPRSEFSVPAGRLVKTPMPEREGIPSGNGALATPERRERVALWNVRNGFALGCRLRGDDPAKTMPGNYYPNGLMARLGDPGVAETGGHVLGELVLESPVDQKELKESVEWTKAHADELFLGRVTADKINKYARWRILVKYHPEWFGLVDGVRVPTSISLLHGIELKGRSSMPCLSNPEVRELMVRNLLARRDRLYKGHPVVFCLCCDDHSQWCECDECMKLLKCKGENNDKDKASDYWWDFINWISERLLADPTVSLKVYVYRTYRTYPKRVKPIARDRMSIILCPHGRCYLHSLTDPKCKSNAKYRAMLEQWTREGMPVIAFEYMNQTPGKCNYAFWERAWIDDLKWYAANGISHGAGGLVGPWDGYRSDDGYFRRNAAKARWQIGWLSGHFEWDPDDDFDEVRERLFKVYYRAAAKPMMEYRALLGKAIYATGQCMCYGSGPLFSAAAFQPGVLTGAKRLLEESAALAKGDAELERRIAADAEWFRTNWEAAGVTGDVAVEMTRAAKPPSLDGRLDEPFWRIATPLDDFRHIVMIGDTMNRPEKRYSPATTIKLAFDDNFLYLACVCTKAGGKTVDEPPDGSTFDAMRGSCIELHLMSPSMGGKYYHVAVSHNGKVYSALTESGRVRDLDRPLKFRHAIADAPGAWTLEMAVPLSEFGGAKPGDVWKLDAARIAAGDDGKLIRGYGSLCGYGEHAPEYWRTVSFGAPSNLLSNGGFEDLVPPPVKASGNEHRNNGRGWTFLSAKMPAVWFYQQNGGVGEAVSDGAAEGRSFLRLKWAKRGYSCFLWQDMLAYPGETKTLRFSFRARGKGKVTAQVMQPSAGKTRRVTTAVDSAEWKAYSCEIPLDGLHPSRFMFSAESDQLDLDDLSLSPER